MSLSATSIINARVRKRLREREREAEEARKRAARFDPRCAALWAEIKALAPTDPRESFRRFCHELVRIPTKTGGELVPFRWNDIQRRFCEARTGRDIALKARQVGFTTLEEARDVWFALTRDGVNVAVVTIPDAKHLYTRKIVADLERMIDHLGFDTGARWSGTQVTFGNGSTVTVFDSGGSVKAAGKTARSGTVHRAHLTEAAFYPYAELTTTALLRALPSVEQGGELTEESTPNGAGGVFYDHWQSAEAGTSTLTGHFYPWFLMAEYAAGGDRSAARARDADEEELLAAATELGVELTAAQLRWWREQRDLSGAPAVTQEYPHSARKCFLLSGSTFFDASAVERLEARADAPLDLDDLPAALAALVRELSADDPDGVALRVWEAPRAGASYLASTDTAGGKRTGDWPSTLFFDAETRRHVATYRQKVPPSEYGRRLARVGRAFNTALLVVERNHHGGTVLTVLIEQEHYPEVWYDHRGDAGWCTTSSSRGPAVDGLADAFLRDEFDTRDALVSSEARTFVRYPDGVPRAQSGCHDDVILAAAIGWRLLSLPRPGPAPAPPSVDIPTPWAEPHGF